MLSPFTSFPAVPGHEVLATVSEVGDNVPAIAEGDRVVVDPFISCEMRGLPPCGPCANGLRCLCTNTAEGALSPGMLIGFCRDVPGGWAEEMVAHQSQVYAVPPELPDTLAVLVEPLSIGLHAVLKAPPAAGSNVLVIGAGSVGMTVLAAIRLLEIPCHVTVVARYPFQASMATRLGAALTYQEPEAAAVEVAGAKSYRPLRGSRVYAGGFDQVFDCVGSPRSVDQGMRVAGPDATVMLVGCAGEIPRLDLTPVWSRELHLTGSYGYGTEHSRPDAPHTFELAMELLQQRQDYPIADIVTHRFPLTDWRNAMRVNLSRGQHGAIKTVFDCQAAG